MFAPALQQMLVPLFMLITLFSRFAVCAAHMHLGCEPSRRHLRNVSVAVA